MLHHQAAVPLPAHPVAPRVRPGRGRPSAIDEPELGAGADVAHQEVFAVVHHVHRIGEPDTRGRILLAVEAPGRSPHAEQRHRRCPTSTPPPNDDRIVPATRRHSIRPAVGHLSHSSAPRLHRHDVDAATCPSWRRSALIARSPAATVRSGLGKGAMRWRQLVRSWATRCFGSRTRRCSPAPASTSTTWIEPGMAHVVFVRSPRRPRHGHARSTSSDAEAMPGVVAVYHAGGRRPRAGRRSRGSRCCRPSSTGRLRQGPGALRRRHRGRRRRRDAGAGRRRRRGGGRRHRPAAGGDRRPPRRWRRTRRCCSPSTARTCASPPSSARTATRSRAPTPSPR